MQIDQQLVWQCVGVFSAVLSAVLLVLLIYNRRERRRYRAADLAIELSRWNLPRLPALFQAYAVGDYSGMVRGIGNLLDLLKTDGLPKVFEAFFRRLLEHFVKDGDWRAEIRTAVDAAELPAKVPPTP